MNMQSMRIEMLDWLTLRGASAEDLARFAGHWDEAMQRTPSQPEGPCPTCFAKGNLAIVEMLSTDSGLSRAQCIDCGCRFIWSTRTTT